MKNLPADNRPNILPEMEKLDIQNIDDFLIRARNGEYPKGEKKEELEWFEIPDHGLEGIDDVFAADEETILIIECKSNEKRRRKELKKDIAEYSDLKNKLREQREEITRRFVNLQPLISQTKLN